MKRECFTYKSRGFNTGGVEEDILVCYCNTTSCNKIQTKFYSLPNDFNKVQIEICGCGSGDIKKDEIMCPKCERNFYDNLYKI